VSDIRWLPNSENLFLASHYDGSLIVYDKEKEDAPFVAEATAAGDGASSESGKKPRLQVRKSVNSRNQKTNPVSYWWASSARINAFAFSPDCRLLAVVSEDGSFRIIDFLREK
jgi:catabolite repression protein CreC